MAFTHIDDYDQLEHLPIPIRLHYITPLIGEGSVQAQADQVFATLLDLFVMTVT